MNFKRIPDLIDTPFYVINNIVGAEIVAWEPEFLELIGDLKA